MKVAFLLGKTGYKTNRSSLLSIQCIFTFHIKMKVAIVFSVFFVIALASPLPDGVPGHYTNVQDEAGQYALSYLADRVSHVEQGFLKQVGNAVILAKRGSYVFIGDDGKKYLTSYIADENGFRPVGDHIPVIE